MAIFKNVKRPTEVVNHSGQDFTLTMISALERAEVGRYWDAYNDDVEKREKESGKNAAPSVGLFRDCLRESDTHLIVKTLLPALAGTGEEELTAEVSNGFSAELFDFLSEESKKINRMIEGKKEEEKNPK